MASYPSANCNVFVTIFVDSNEVSVSSGTSGMYAVDNMLSNGSSNEGSASLTTQCAKGNTICWQALNINPGSNAPAVAIQSIGNSNAWGPTGQPLADPTNPGAFTGQAQNGGNGQPYQVTLTVGGTGGATLNASLNVTG